MRINAIDIIGGAVLLSLLVYNLLTGSSFLARDIAIWVLT